MKWCVITDDGYKDGHCGPGVLCNAEVWPIDGGQSEYLTEFGQKAFTRGEIFVVDDAFNREQNGDGRSPDKWEVNYELFDLVDYEKAISRAMEVS